MKNCVSAKWKQIAETSLTKMSKLRKQNESDLIMQTIESLSALNSENWWVVFGQPKGKDWNVRVRTGFGESFQWKNFNKDCMWDMGVATGPLSMIKRRGHCTDDKKGRRYILFLLTEKLKLENLRI